MQVDNAAQMASHAAFITCNQPTLPIATNCTNSTLSSAIYRGAYGTSLGSNVTVQQDTTNANMPFWVAGDVDSTTGRLHRQCQRRSLYPCDRFIYLSSHVSWSLHRQSSWDLDEHFQRDEDGLDGACHSALGQGRKPERRLRRSCRSSRPSRCSSFAIIHRSIVVYSEVALHWDVVKVARCAAISRIYPSAPAGEVQAGGVARKGTRPFNMHQNVYVAHRRSCAAAAFVVGVDTANQCRKVSGTASWQINAGVATINVPLSANACFPTGETTTGSWPAS